MRQANNFIGADPRDVLKSYWGYDSFRPLQEEIISSVLSRHDTLALMPTGGGKSITFQVPALIFEGITIVVTPLISLMKDQVDNLRAHDVPATFIHSGLSRREAELAIDKCRYGKVKLLYLSPEKLQSPSWETTVRQFDVSLIVVDEAHCISQWGYDFRPSYLKIGILRKIFPQAPIMALTASATKAVADDICEKLSFHDNAQRFSLSFERHNISYIVRPTTDKIGEMCRILHNTSGTGIVYVRSRKRTTELAQALIAEGISADAYHAGLSPEEKNERQNRWKNDETRIIVATTAFGMGIDKPDVRTVIHYDIPSSLEEYYQEAGRAGRDGKPSFAILLTNNYDRATLTRRVTDAYPPKDFIRKVYTLTGAFLDVAVGTGYTRLFEFDLRKFCQIYKLDAAPTHRALNILTQAGYIEYNDDSSSQARVMMIMNREELYSLALPDDVDKILTVLLRTCAGLFADYVYFSEASIAMKLNMTQEQVYKGLLMLAKMHVLHYVPRRTCPYVLYTTAREEERHIIIPRTVYEDRIQQMTHRIEAMRRFAFLQEQCRVEILLDYFGQKAEHPCGQCDYCRNIKEIKGETVKAVLSPEAALASLQELFASRSSITLPEIITALGGNTETRRNAIIEAIRLLADDGKLSLDGITVALTPQ